MYHTRRVQGLKNNLRKEVDSKRRNEKCRKMDHYALIVFLGAYGITVFSYFTAYNRN